jgi:hypothetical protein
MNQELLSMCLRFDQNLMRILIFIMGLILLAYGCAPPAPKPVTERKGDPPVIAREDPVKANPALKQVDLLSKLNEALLADPVLSGPGAVLDLRVTDKVVTISGRVDDKALKDRAEKLMRQEMKKRGAKQTLDSEIEVGKG